MGAADGRDARHRRILATLYKGKIVLLQRGSCTFIDKISHGSKSRCDRGHHDEQ